MKAHKITADEWSSWAKDLCCEILLCLANTVKQKPWKGNIYFSHFLTNTPFWPQGSPANAPGHRWNSRKQGFSFLRWLMLLRAMVQPRRNRTQGTFGWPAPKSNLHPLHITLSSISAHCPQQQSHTCLWLCNKPFTFPPQLHPRAQKCSDYYNVIWRGVQILVTLKRWWFRGWDHKLCGKTEQDVLHVVTRQPTALRIFFLF